MDTREIILDAAARVYSQHGFRGSTTRRIADAAAVNEITIFRYFGSKAALLQEAVKGVDIGSCRDPLPSVPVDPMAELGQWAATLVDHLSTCSSVIRKCMSEIEERPEMITTAVSTPVRAANDLSAYLRKLKSMGLAAADFDVAAAGSMLLGAIFHDAMGREMMPQIYPAQAKAPRLYSRLLLNAIGYKTGNGGTR